MAGDMEKCTESRQTVEEVQGGLIQGLSLEETGKGKSSNSGVLAQGLGWEAESLSDTRSPQSVMGTKPVKLGSLILIQALSNASCVESVWDSGAKRCNFLFCYQSSKPALLPGLQVLIKSLKIPYL